MSDDATGITLSTSRAYRGRMVALFVLAASIATLIVAQALHELRGGTPSTARVALMLAIAVLAIALPWLPTFGRRGAVIRLDAYGVTLRDGRTFDWMQLERVVAHRRRYSHAIDHYELRFHSGRARVFHQIAANREEVELALASLSSGIVPFSRPR